MYYSTEHGSDIIVLRAKSQNDSPNEDDVVDERDLSWKLVPEGYPVL